MGQASHAFLTRRSITAGSARLRTRRMLLDLPPKDEAIQQSSNDTHPAAAKVPWNKAKMIVARPPLQIKHVWSIPPSDYLEKRPIAMQVETRR